MVVKNFPKCRRIFYYFGTCGSTRLYSTYVPGYFAFNCATRLKEEVPIQAPAGRSANDA